MAKRKKCRCDELAAEVQWHKGRAAMLQGVLRRLVEIEDERRLCARDYERAVIDARGLIPERGREDDR